MLSIRDLCRLGLMAALLEVSKQALASVPNIELVSFWIILFTLYMGWKTLYAVYVFVFIEGVLFGVHFWWVSYLYVWAILIIFTQICHSQKSILFWSMFSAMFGLSFGAFCSIPYAVTGILSGGLWNGVLAGFSWWVAGIPYDLLHCAGNFAIMLILYKPVQNIMKRLF